MKNIQEFALNIDENIEMWFSVLNQQYHIDPTMYEKITGTWDDILSKGSALLLSAFQYALGLTGQVTNGVINFFVAVIISIYLLMSREHFFAQLRKVLYAFFQKKTVEKMLYVGNLTSRTFNGFINGKLIDFIDYRYLGVYLSDHYENAVCIINQCDHWCDQCCSVFWSFCRRHSQCFYYLYCGPHSGSMVLSVHPDFTADRWKYYWP